MEKGVLVIRILAFRVSLKVILPGTPFWERLASRAEGLYKRLQRYTNE